jgi:hypothetical protein
MQYPFSDGRMQRFLGHNIHIATQQFLEICQESSREEGRPLGPGIYEKIHITVTTCFTSCYRAEDSDVVGPMFGSKPQDFLTLRG